MRPHLPRPGEDAADMGPAFHQMIDLNETLKEIVLISRRVELSAHNAMLMARRAGATAVGFGVVSEELRQFSHRLETTVATLSKQIFGLVAEMSRAVVVQRRRRLLAAAAALREESRLASAVERHGAQLAELARAVRLGRSQLRLGLVAAVRLCGGGLAISRSARIEAVHGQAYLAGLRQVAGEVEAAIESVTRSLREVEARLAEKSGDWT